ncbi:hypothetical protein [Ekhidna sp.]|uniref:hypothetical protein n=1 Tax=Ekhidna sp. TaxID=2608089 RepID=UPI003BA90E51
MEQNDSNKVPEISIDEALQLYLSMAFPQGLPEGEEGEVILKTIKEKIASERPEWAKASGWQNDQEEDASSYSQIKQQAVEDASKEELPEDPEERYLHLRREEARENSEQKREEKLEEEEKSSQRKALIDKKSSDDEALLKRAALIKKVLLERAKQRLAPDFSDHKVTASSKPSLAPHDSSINHQVVNLNKPAAPTMAVEPEIFLTKDSKAFSTNDIPKPNRKPDAKEWFKDFKTLSVDDRMESIKAYNQKKREMLESKHDLMWDSRSGGKKGGLSFDDDQFEMNEGLSFKSDQSPTFGLKLE